MNVSQEHNLKMQTISSVFIGLVLLESNGIYFGKQLPVFHKNTLHIHKQSDRDVIY